MRIRVLGSAAGGGFPQWNCACRNCAGVRAGTLSAAPRTQASLAVSGDGTRWLLLGASPDVRAQLAAAPALWPTAGGSPIIGAALPNGDLDAWVGLLSLREWTPLELLATACVRRGIVDDNAILRTLERFDGHTRWRELVPGARVTIGGGLALETVAAPGKAPLHLRGRRAPDALDNVGFVVRDARTEASVAWFPTVAGPSPAVERALDRADVVFFDGTFWSDDELIAAGRGSQRARDLAHWPVGGPEGSAAFLSRLPARRKWLIHVNNTNPLLVDDSPERTRLRAAGVEVAHDGLELEA